MTAPVTVTAADEDARNDYVAGVHGDFLETAFARHRQQAEAASKAREDALVEALGNAKWLLEGIKRAGWVTSPSYGDDINLGLERINTLIARAKASSDGGDG